MFYMIDILQNSTFWIQQILFIWVWLFISTTKSAAESTRNFNKHAQHQGGSCWLYWCRGKPREQWCMANSPISTEEEEALARRKACAGFRSTCSRWPVATRSQNLAVWAIFCVNVNWITRKRHTILTNLTAAETIDCFYTLSWSFGGSAMVDVDGRAVHEGSGCRFWFLQCRGKSGRVHGAALTGAFLCPQKISRASSWSVGKPIT